MILGKTNWISKVLINQVSPNQIFQTGELQKPSADNYEERHIHQTRYQQNTVLCTS